MSPARLRVMIDLSSAVRHGAGIGRYAAELARALLAELPPDESLEAFTAGGGARRLPAPLAGLPAKTQGEDGRRWRLRVMLAHLLRHGQDAALGRPGVFLAADHVLPYLTAARSLFVLYDLTFQLFPATHQPLNRWFSTLMVPRFARRAGAVLAISEATRRDALRHYRLPAERLHVVYPGVAEHFQPVANADQLATIRRRYALPARFVLFVGTLEPRKNLPTALRAFRAAAPPEVGFVIAGQAGWRAQSTLAAIRDLGLEARVGFCGYVPDEDLPALYTLAEALLFPSLYEGFGLPPLEAMACGAPVLASNTSSLPEVVGEAGLTLPPDQPQAWAEALARVFDDAVLRAELSERGRRQAARFRWATAARQVRELYRRPIPDPRQ